MRAFKISEISIFEKKISEDEKKREKFYEAVLSMKNGTVYNIRSDREDLVDRIFSEIINEKEKFLIIGDGNLLINEETTPEKEESINGEE